MSRTIILGCVPMGKHMAIDLFMDPDCEVISVDIRQEVLQQLAKKHPLPDPGSGPFHGR